MHNKIYKFRKLKLETSFFRRQGATQSDSASGPEIISRPSNREFVMTLFISENGLRHQKRGWS